MAEQDFEQLLKTVQQLNQQLADLASKATAAKTALKGVTDPTERVSAGGRIGGLQTALNKVEADLRQAMRDALREVGLTRQGIEKGAPYGRVPGEGFSVLGPAPVKQGLEAANIQGKIDTEVRKFAKDVATRFQRSLIEGVIESKVQNIPFKDVDINQINETQNRYLRNAISRKQLTQPTSLDLKRAADEAFIKSQTSSRVNVISHPPLTPDQNENRVLRSAIEDRKRTVTQITEQVIKGTQDLNRLVAELRSLRETGKSLKQKPTREQEALQKAINDYALVEKSLAKEQFRGTAEGITRQQLRGKDFRELDAVSTKQQLEEEALNSLRGRLQAEKRYTSVLRAAAEKGFTLDDLVSGRTRGTAGIEEFRFRKYDTSGVQQQLDLFNTPGGRTTAGIGNQFRTFGQGVARDIGELTKWSIALAAVYGPMRKLGELVNEMIANQTKLVEATVSVNNAFITQSTVFDIAAESAEGAGESISGVIDAFTQAYRAAGGGVDQVERLDRAQKLLNDSLILSKLSTLDQAQAIDTLAAAVRQTGGDFDKTTQLLDSWVRVTKVANVDLATLATGFAVVGDAAEAAGIDTDELNGIIAAVAETGVGSGKEVANIARSLVSGFQSDQARKELENLGIAVEDSTGTLRPFLDIMKEIANLRKSGIIDDTQFSRLTLALGGGTRRQAAYTTFIENLSRVYDVASESALANGDAQQALARQLESVQTSLTGLQNAFTTLAQSLGTEGGFLGIIKLGVENMTSLVNVFDSLVSVLGKATPAMAAFIATSLALKYRGGGSIQNAIFGFGERVTSGLPGEFESRLAAVTGATGVPSQRATNQRRAGSAISALTGTGVVGGVAQGLLLSAIPALLNLQNKDDRFREFKAGADVVGGVAGGIIGALVAGSPAIGAAIGTAIAETFVNSTIDRTTNIFAFGTGPSLGTSFTPSTVNDKEAALEQARINIYKSVGGGNEAYGRFLTSGPEKLASTLVDEINDAIKNGDKEKLTNILGRTRLNANYNAQEALKAAGISPELVQSAFAQGKPIQFAPENVAYRRASEQAQREYDVALRGYKATAGEAATETTFSRMVSQNNQLYGELLNNLKASSKATLGQQRLAGDVTGADYTRRVSAVGGFDTKALNYYTALGEEFIRINEHIDDAGDAFEAFNQILISGTADTIPEITSIVSEIEKLVNILGDPALQTEDMLKSLGFENLNDVDKRLKELRETGGALLTDVYKQSLTAGVKVPSIFGDISKPLTTPENVLVEQRTKQLQNTFYQDFLKLPDEMYDILKEGFEEFAVTIKDSGDEFYQKVVETDQQFRQAAIQQLQEEGKLRSQKETPFGIQQVDMTSAQGAGLQGSVDYFSRYLGANFPQYKQNPEDVGIIFSDYVTSVLHGDNLAIKLALEKIVDLNQKQLDGMYNIPEGATFWVPLTAAYYRPQNGGGAGGGLPALDAQAVDGNTSATQLNTQALMNLTDKWNNADPFLYKRPSEPHENRYDKMNEEFSLLTPAEKARTDLMRGRGFNPYAHQDRYDKMQTSTATPPTGFLESLLQGLRNFFGGMGDMYRDNSRLNPASRASITNNNATATQPQPVQARLDLRFDNSVQLIVDGRVLASVITPYLATDLIRLEASQGTITKRYVI